MFPEDAPRPAMPGRDLAISAQKGGFSAHPAAELTRGASADAAC
ncbi:MAG: hypothetical protein RIT24_578 [Planctomycetota bacterium]